MTVTESLILGTIQGLTEFLPISSSGHLVLGQHYLGLDVDGLKSFDVLVHVGTLMAILIYFRRDIWGMAKGFFLLLAGKLPLSDPYAKLIGYVLIGSIPAVIFGFTLEDWMDTNFRNVTTVGICMFVVGVIFLLGEASFRYAHKKNPLRDKTLEKVAHVRDAIQPEGYEPVEIYGMNWKKALIIGFAQAIALLPGVSRSGSTIVAGLFQGVERSSAARFSFLLGAPVIFGAGLLTAIKHGDEIANGFTASVLLAGFFSSFFVGLLTISFLMRYLKNHTLLIFSIYLIAVGLYTWIA